MKRFIIIISIIVTLLIVYLIRPQPIDTYTTTYNTDLMESFEGILYLSLLDDLNELGIPGLQATVISNDRKYDISVGTVDYKRRQDILTDNILRAGSISKIYTSVIIMRLREDGLIDLNSSIDQWFQQLPNASEITIQSLMNHTSGIYNYTENLLFQLKTVFMPKSTWKTQELYNYALKGKPYFKPGEDHFYSNTNYLLLALIAEMVTGKSYGDLLHEIIIDPLELKNTYFLPYDGDPALLITGYDRDVIPLGVNKIKPTNRAFASSGYSAGGIAANSSDIAIFLEALFSQKIISKDSLEKMMDFKDFTDEDVTEQTGYGLGFRRLVIEGDTLIGHTGTIPGFGGAAFYCPEKDYYITILANLSYLDQVHILSTIIKTLE